MAYRVFGKFRSKIFFLHELNLHLLSLYEIKFKLYDTIKTLICVQQLIRLHVDTNRNFVSRLVFGPV